MHISQRLDTYRELWELYMTPDGVYLRMISNTKDPHWFPHFIIDNFLLQEIAYQTHINDVSTSLMLILASS
jgi:hypothetical protein